MYLLYLRIIKNTVIWIFIYLNHTSRWYNDELNDIQRDKLKSQLIICVLFGRRSNLSRRTSAVFQIYLASHRIQSTTASETTTCGSTFWEALGTLVPRIPHGHTPQGQAVSIVGSRFREIGRYNSPRRTRDLFRYF